MDIRIGYLIKKLKNLLKESILIIDKLAETEKTSNYKELYYENGCVPQEKLEIKILHSVPYIEMDGIATFIEIIDLSTNQKFYVLTDSAEIDTKMEIEKAIWLVTTDYIYAKKVWNQFIDECCEQTEF